MLCASEIVETQRTDPLSGTRAHACNYIQSVQSHCLCCSLCISLVWSDCTCDCNSNAAFSCDALYPPGSSVSGRTRREPFTQSHSLVYSATRPQSCDPGLDSRALPPAALVRDLGPSITDGRCCPHDSLSLGSCTANTAPLTLGRSRCAAKL